jgi:hypothetical protein
MSFVEVGGYPLTLRKVCQTTYKVVTMFDGSGAVYDGEGSFKK